MLPSRRSRRDLTITPQRVDVASEPITQRTAVFPVPVSAPRAVGPVPREAVAVPVAPNPDTLTGIGSAPVPGVRSGTFSLRETLLFGAAPEAAAPEAAAPAPAPPAAAPAPTRRTSRPRQPPARAATMPSRESRELEPPAPAPIEAREKKAPSTPQNPARKPAPSPRQNPAQQPAPGEAHKPPAGDLFRSAVLEARRADGFAPEPRSGTQARRWGLLSLILSLIVLSGVGAALASVEVTAEAQGVLRAPNGLRPVASALAGAVTEVLVESGDAVEAGAVVARLEATELRASLLARERELELVRQDVAGAEKHDALLEGEAARALQRRRAALRERLDVGAERREQRRAHDQSLATLVREGGASRAEGLAATEALQEASEVVSSLSNELAVLDLEVADRARQAQERQSARRTQLGRAEAAVEEARALLAASAVRAPAAGRIESLLVGPGAVIAAGAVLGNIVPSGAPRTITTFIPSREIAFVQPGAPASVELQSLSVSEFGLAQARVTRVSTEVATAAELQTVLNEAVTGPHVRVELELIDSPTSAAIDPLLRSGERVKVRLHRRERRLITLLFDFVRRWVS